MDGLFLLGLVIGGAAVCVAMHFYNKHHDRIVGLEHQLETELEYVHSKINELREKVASKVEPKA